MSRIIPLAWLAIFVVIVIAPGASTEAWAHAFPTKERPLVGSTINKPPSTVTIWYDAPIQPLFAKLDVLDSAGHQEDTGAPTVEDHQRALSVKLKPLKPGNFTVKWGVVAEDGHRTEGSYEFTVAGFDP
ncbi:MAG: copper resistance CopC family protein [Candidatus Binataceae bacterium]